MKREIKKQKSQNDSEVNVHDDALMVSLGMRQPLLTPRDKSVWTKTPNERRILKNVKYSSRGGGHFHTIPFKSIPVKSKLIIQLQNNKVYPKSTYSIECLQSDIPNIISKYVVTNKKSGVSKNIVVKYSWNGKSYKPNQIPAW